MADYDVAVVGAGAAGLAITAIAAAVGLRVALIERGRMGGSHLNHGCVPATALLAAARVAATARSAGRFGLRLPPPEIDWQGVRAHVRGAVARLAPNDSALRFRAMGVTVIEAPACFTGADTLEAGGRRLTFRRAVIAAGTAPVVPNLPGLDTVPWLTSDTLFDLAEAPGHLVILGGGATGIEMAQAHARLGCRVTLLEAAPRIAPAEDPELAEGLRRALLADGVTLREGAAATGVCGEGGVVVTLGDGSTVTGTHLLLALGRTPRLGGLDLAAAGIESGPQGIRVGRDLRSVSNRRVWAAGEIADPEGIGPRAGTHVATQHAGILLRSMLLRLPGTRFDDAAVPRIIGTDPALVQIGLTEAAAIAGGHDGMRILRAPLADTERAAAEAQGEGLVKLIVSAKGRLLGAGMVGPQAAEMAGAWGLMIGRRLPVSALAGLALPHPTLSEAAKRAATEFYAPKLLSPAVKRLIGLLRLLP